MIQTTFRAEIFIKGYCPTTVSWVLKDSGYPSDATLAAFIKRFEEVNGETVHGAEIVRQANGDIEATYPVPQA